MDANNPTCKVCGDKLESDINWSAKSQRRNEYTCKPCINADQRRRQGINKQRAIEYLGGKCKDCSGVYVRDVYDFHHRNPEEKDFSIGDGLLHKWEKIEPELDKCDLLCSNCHRIRHYEERIAA